MPQKINLTKSPGVEIIPELSSSGSQPDNYEKNLEYLILLYPDKILFCIKDASGILGQSYEFLRVKVHEGKVSAKAYGARRMIHRLELARLITEGL